MYHYIGGSLSKSLRQEWIHSRIKVHQLAQCRIFSSSKSKVKKKGSPADKDKDDAMKETCRLPDDMDQPSVVIIGAGMAGLSAAQRLAQCGLTRFRILEATERPGGRLKTCWVGDKTVELGADSIWGASLVNPVLTMAAQEGLFGNGPLDRICDSTGMVMATSSGIPIDQGIVDRVRPRWEAMAAQAATLVSEQGSLKHRSLSTYLEQTVNGDLSGVMSGEKFETSSAFYGFLTGLKAQLGEDLSNVSAKYFGSRHETGGGKVTVGLGMAGLLAPLMRCLPPCSLLLCKPVHCVRWGAAGPSAVDTPAPRAVVSCCDGEQIAADYVIVTVPLGVLKANPNFFCPELPANKTEAIEALGVGHLNKVFLVYDEPFWHSQTGAGTLRLAWTPQELKAKGKWWKDICEFSSVGASRRVVCATVAGQGAKIIESLEDVPLANALTQTLRSFTGDRWLPAPREIVRSSWSTFPYSMGAFTAMLLDSSPGNVRDLGAALPDQCVAGAPPPVILFAGEHTHPTEYATLQGARRSGFREADRILELTRKLKGPPNKEPPCPPCK